MPDDAAAAAAPTFRVLQTDMTQTEVVDICARYTEAREKHKHEKDVATAVKKALDEAAGGGTWHVIVGAKFGCSVAHASRKMVFFKAEDAGHHVLAFQSFELDLAAAASH